MRVIEHPYDRWSELTLDGQIRTFLVGRVPQISQWIKVVFIGYPDTGELLTAYQDRRLERRYGGRPWEND